MVTNRWLGLPIFAVVMFLVYWISMIGVGVAATDWANDGLFGDGYHLFGMGTSEAEAAAEEYGEAQNAVDAFLPWAAQGRRTPPPPWTRSLRASTRQPPPPP